MSPRSTLQPITAGIVSHPAKWTLLAAGAFLIGLAVLILPWQQNEQLRWQHRLLTQQSERLARQTQAYHDFDKALHDKEAVLLERLAYHQLRLKPKGADTLAGVLGEAGIQRARNNHFPYNTAVRQTGETAELRPGYTVEDWLAIPLPQPGEDFPLYLPYRSRLMRLATGPCRLILMLAGALFISASLMSSTIKTS